MRVQKITYMRANGSVNINFDVAHNRFAALQNSALTAWHLIKLEPVDVVATSSNYCLLFASDLRFQIKKESISHYSDLFTGHNDWVRLFSINRANTLA